MNEKQKPNYSLFILASTLIIGFMYLFIQKQPGLLENVSVLFAVVMVFPLCLATVYYFTIGRIKRSLKTFPGIAVTGLFILYWLMPFNLREQYILLKYTFFVIEGFFILLELLIFIYLLKNIGTFIRVYRNEQEKHFYFLSTYKHALEKVFGHAFFPLRIMMTELAIPYYLTYRKKKREVPIPYPMYSYHKNAEYFGIFLMLVHAMLIEIVGVHILVMQWSGIAAWIVTFFDVYFLFFLIADYRAITLSPVVLTEDKIHVQMGIRSFLELDCSNIESINWESTEKQERKKEKGAYYVTLPAFFEKDPKLEIRLKHPVESTGIFGLKKMVRKVYVTVDDAKEFYKMVLEKVNKLSCEEEK